ncbi:MAG TPA: tripartite tricarboxylate transporter substrate binding protein [Burkholderiales bacterium]|nr:tripartite tricarboxylate transporter substrate binding protein [Burkholderiales bacterium]
MRPSAVLAATLVASWASGALAQTYPDRPVRVVVPFPAAGGTDILARLLLQRMAERLRANFVIDNRAGAGGTIGTEIVAKAAPDGYTILVASSSHTINPSVYKKIGYDPARDFAPVTLIASGPGVLVVHPSVPAKNVKELIALAKSKPGQLIYASAGNGTPPHLAAELFKSMAGVDLVHIPYKGNVPAFVDLLTGAVSLSFPTITSGLPQVRSGKLRALGVTSKQRSTVVPDVPTIAESGLPGYEATTWYGMLVPAKTRMEVIAKLHDHLVEVLKLPDIREKLLAQGLEPVANGPDEFGAIISTELVKWSKVVAAAGVKAE